MISEDTAVGKPERLFLSGVRLAAGGKRLPDFAIDTQTLMDAATFARDRWMFTHFAEGLLPILSHTHHDWLSTELRVWKAQVMQGNAILVSRSGQIAKILVKNNLTGIMFKGVAQQKQIYDDFFVRPASDMDILVAKHDFRKVLQVLDAAGFQPKFKKSLWWETFLGERHLYYRDETQRALDVHNRLQQPGLPRPKRLDAFLTSDAVIGHRGQDWPVVPRRLLPLIPAMNLVKGLVSRHKMLGHAWDLSHLLGHGSTARVASFMQVAHAHGLTGTALVALRALNALFPGPYSDMNARLAKTLVSLSDDDLVCTLIGTREAPAPLRRRDILVSASERHMGRILREGVWYGLSEVTRRFDKEHLHDDARGGMIR